MEEGANAKLSGDGMQTASDATPVVISTGPSKLAPFPQDNAGKIAMAKTYKDAANEHFKQTQYKKAISNYNKAIAFTKGLPGRQQGLDGMSQMAVNHSAKMSAEEEAALNTLDVVVKTNIATCYIKLNDGLKALKAADEALAINPRAWKSLMRKAEALILVNNSEKALTVLDEALNAANGPDLATEEKEKERASATANIAKVRERAVQAQKLEEKRQKKAFSGLFERAQKKGESIAEEQARLHKLELETR